ncbi:MAG TPA: AMIN domain-containing protein [Candidatus Sulfotelmatobacter sp.]|jgi:Tfp pilus assembly protein PilP|nr:AMIN domain-containing protein [Candidatus Sulfotelmatobacter sp.]
MKLTTGILAVAITVTAGAAFAQNPDAIDNARSVAKSLQQKQANDTNAALDAAGVKAQSKPAPGAPAPAVKPVVIPAAKPAVASAPAPAPKPETSSAQHNQLQKVNVVSGADTVKVEISSSQAVTPRVSKLSSPARVVVELPETVVASSQNKIPVGSGGVKGVRIGMDGKNPPTTSVVVDLDKALAYEVTPGADGKLVLTLHTQDAASAKVVSAPLKPVAAPAVAKANMAPTVKLAVAPKGATIVAEAGKPAPAPKVAVAKAELVKPVPAPKSLAASPKPESKIPAKTVVAAKSAPAPEIAVASAPAEKTPASQQPKPQDKKWAMNGKRDPFFSPVVQQSGSGCATGKKCLEINAINLRGVVKSEVGFIAVVTNNLGKAYFLRENDPVFNGFVVKITGDSVTFSETIQDKLGKTSTREVVKRIFTPAV